MSRQQRHIHRVSVSSVAHLITQPVQPRWAAREVRPALLVSVRLLRAVVAVSKCWSVALGRQRRRSTIGRVAHDHRPARKH
jgi:hypothetical protein